jgi:asparagine synthase (glutamine-hydrolysing)
LELKKELKGLGHAFVTESDTEVLLFALAAFGDKGLDRCEGMWAFALYEESEGRLLLSRDRFSEKPLYLFEDSEGIFFASEVKFLSALCGQAFRVNEAQIYRYLVNGYKSLYKGQETFFRGVSELSPSTVLQIGPRGEKTLEPYWTPKVAEDASVTFEKAVAGAREQMIESVRMRLRADVPLAFCMSGGVDSNTLISIAKRVFDYDVHGFTIVVPDERYAEQDLVEVAIRDLGIRHTSIPVTSRGFLPNLRSLIEYHDAPIYTVSYYAHWLLMKSIAEHGYRVAVSGTGADELFTGYYDHHNMYLSEVSGDPQVYQSSLGSWQEHIAPIVRNPFLKDPKVFIERPAERGHIYLDAEGFAQYLKAPFHEAFSEKHYVAGLLRNRMMNELFHEVVPVILHEDDLNSMYFSIENRSPFLDRRLFEFCYSIPTRHLIREGFNKAVLREAMRGIVPDRILDTRRKVGFNAPIYSFLDVHDPEVRAYLLDGGPIYDHVHKPMIEKLIAKEFLPNSESKFLFNFLCSKMFLEMHAS